MKSADYLGMELQEAVLALESLGYGVTLEETRSKKGVDGSERRVVRVRETGEGSVALVWALFKTDVYYEAM